LQEQVPLDQDRSGGRAERAIAQIQVEGRLFLDVVVRERARVLQRFTGEDELLLIGRDAFHLLNLLLCSPDGIEEFNTNGNGFASQRLDEDLHGSRCCSPGACTHPPAASPRTSSRR